MFTKFIQFSLSILALVLCSCMAPLDGEPESEDDVAKDFYGNVMSGQIWSTPAGAANALGGVGNVVAMGELELADPTVQQATLTLGLQQPNAGTNFGTGRIMAQISYGIGSANQTLIVDWGKATSVALPVGRTTITAIQTDSQGAPALTLPAGYAIQPGDTLITPVILTASLAAGDRSSVHAPTVTQNFSFAAGALVGLIPPTRAKALIVGDPRGQALSDIRVDVVSGNSVNRFFLANANDSAIRTTGIVLGTAYRVIVSSPGGVNNVYFCWLLDG